MQLVAGSAHVPAQVHPCGCLGLEVGKPGEVVHTTGRGGGKGPPGLPTPPRPPSRDKKAFAPLGGTRPQGRHRHRRLTKRVFTRSPAAPRPRSGTGAKRRGAFAARPSSGGNRERFHLSCRVLRFRSIKNCASYCTSCRRWGGSSFGKAAAHLFDEARVLRRRWLKKPYVLVVGLVRDKQAAAVPGLDGRGVQQPRAW